MKKTKNRDPGSCLMQRKQEKKCLTNSEMLRQRIETEMGCSRGREGRKRYRSEGKEGRK